ncbi:MAG: phage tail sheath subtilisin-like domain-containing protein, partial [Bdellovibrionota bacterium]
MSFDQIPSNLKIPFIRTEFGIKAKATVGSLPWKNLLWGQKLSGGSATANQLVRIFKGEQTAKFGSGSMLKHMFDRYFDNNKVDEVWALPLADNGAGVQATGTFALSGTATAAGTWRPMIAGRRLSVAVASGATAATVASALNAAINADTDLPVTSGVVTATVTVTARHKGEAGNAIDLRNNYYTEDALPAGLSCVVTAMSGGTGNPDITTPLAAIGDEWHQNWAFPWTDSANVGLVKPDLLARFDANKAIGSIAYSGAIGNLSTLTTLGDTHNNGFFGIVAATGEPFPSYEKASGLVGAISPHALANPARPFKTIVIKGILPPLPADQFDSTERNSLLASGISTTIPTPDGQVAIERLVTTYKKDAQNAPDESFYDPNTAYKLERIRYDWNNYIAARYPRHIKVSNAHEGKPGLASVSPNTIKGELIVRAKLWEREGWLDDYDQFVKDASAVSG